MVRRGRGRDLCLCGVSPARARRVCACRSRYGLSSDMIFEEFRRYLEELQCIQSAVEDGGFPLSNPNLTVHGRTHRCGCLFHFPHLLMLNGVPIS